MSKILQHKLVKMKLLLILFSISLTAAENPALQDFTNANNLFAKSFYQKISNFETGNILLSPFSAEAVLAFLQSGTKGETGEELRNALHLPNDQTKVETAVKTLLPKFKSNGLYTLYTANKMYIKKHFDIKTDFKNAASEVYDAEIEDIDFTSEVKAAKIMNDWVEKHTNNKIKDLISSSNLDENTRSVLINALYFQANWSIPFLLAATEKKKFYKTSSDSIEIDTLHHYGNHFNYYECPHLNAQYLELPFKGDEATMVIVLPKEKDGLASLEDQLDQVFAPQHHLQSELLNVELPKFNIKKSLNLVKVLKSLGVSKVFDENHADLSGIAGNKGDLIVSHAEQKTFIDVSEEGVEAAAATYVLVAVPISAPLNPPPPPKNFIADHPFIFYIKVKDLIIFAGRVTDPSTS